jgi:hypothetical protein
MADILALGIDVGTSGVRTAVIDQNGNLVSEARADHHQQTSSNVDAALWWQAVCDCLDAQMIELDRLSVARSGIIGIAVDGTSGSVVLVDDDLEPVTQAQMYNSSGFLKEAERIARHAPQNHITRGSSSTLARMLSLQAEDPDLKSSHLLHQADYIAAKLMGVGGFSDENNTLKLGFDPETGQWPEWFPELGVRTELLPDVRPAGSAIRPVASAIAEKFGFSPNTVVHAGTTDSIAAFLASDATQVGDAVTSLGTTLAIKLLSDVRVDQQSAGIYSHKLGDSWLVGGASNTGGGVLLTFFSAEEMARLSQIIDPATDSGLDYYPLKTKGERFPVNDPDLEPRMEARPQDDAKFLHGLLEGISRIERQCYDALANLGAPEPRRIFTAGGGGKNPVWTEMRQRIVSKHISVEAQNVALEASRGVAKLVFMNART